MKNKKGEFNKFTVKAAVAVIIAFALNSGIAVIPGPALAHATSRHASLKVSRNGLDVQLEWTLSDPTQEAVLYRDGERIGGNVGDGTKIDKLSTLRPANYVLDLSHEMNSTETSLITDEALRARAVTDAKGFEVVEILGVEVGPNVVANSAEASSTASSTLFRYQTFIPDNKIPITGLAPWGCSVPNVVLGGNDYFLGDNRSWAADPSPNQYSPAYRTRVDVTMNWLAPLPNASPNYVGTTNLFHYRPNGSIEHFWLSPDNSSTLVSYSAFDRSSLHFSLYQNVKDPFCASNGIFVDINVNIARSGGFSMFGSRLQAPNHEVYIKDSDSGTWTTLMRSTSPNMTTCLTPLISSLNGCVANVSVSGSR
jgi:hypothetical protein